MAKVDVIKAQVSVTDRRRHKSIERKASLKKSLSAGMMKREMQIRR